MMKMRKLAISFFTIIALTLQCVQAVAVTGCVPTLSAMPHPEGNYISLSWSPNDTSQSYHYMVYKKDLSGTHPVYQSIPLKDNVKVLNVYPDVAGSDGCKGWMATYGNVGNATMTVDKIKLTDFNNNPDNYLYKTGAAYNYDVIYFGAWDWNNYMDLSSNARDAVENFIKYGGGYLAGHDTASALPSSYKPNFVYLADKYLNMVVDTTYSSGYPTSPAGFVPAYTNSPGIYKYGDTSVVVSRKGSLMNYPYKLGDVGTILTTPLSHTFGQFAMGDVWFKYNSNTRYPGTPEINTYGPYSNGTNNFYLTTWNNVAMIQTGHSNGAATNDEQKILANTLYYLAQVSTEEGFDDHTGQDLAAPNAVSSIQVNVDAARKANITFDAAADNGNTYEYYLNAIGNTDNQTYTSNTIQSTITSGVKGYAVVIDQNAETDPGSTVTSASNSFTSSTLSNGTYYVHINAIDNAGNVSSTVHQQFTVSNRAPGEPTDLFGTAGDGSASLVWTAPVNDGGSPITDYIVNYTDGVTPNTIDTQATTTSATVTGLTNGTQYTFTVNAVNSVGESTTSSATTVTPAAPVTVYTAAINLKKDGSDWIGSGKTITLQQADETQTATEEDSGIFTANVTNGTWKILADGADTGRVIVINNEAASQYLNYYTVEFAADDAGTANGSTISATYNSASIDTGDVVLGGGQLVITAVGHAASRYTYQWRGNGTNSETTAALTFSDLSSSVNATCSVTGIGAPPVITTESLPDGTVGIAYNQSLSVSAITSVSWRIVNGFLPEGLTMNPSTGVITGTPTTEGTSTFTVQVLSSYGNNSKTYTVNIAASSVTVPGAPTDAAAAAGNASSIVTWTAPSNDGGSPITDYLVDVYNGTTLVNTVDTGSTDTSATVTGLTNGTSYTFDVKAANSVGESAASSATGAVVPTAPHEPTHPSQDESTSSAPTPAGVQPTITAKVVDGSNNSTAVNSVNAVVVANPDGTDTVKVKPSDAIVLKQPDGSSTPFEDYSKIVYIAPSNAPVNINSDGTVEVSNLAKGSSYDVPVTYDMGNGQKITIGNIHISVDGAGNVNMTSKLIDPYGTLTDSLSGNVISGANVTLYYADTAGNRAAGIAPNTVVKLPIINGFKPNDNQNPQTTDNNGTYGFMVYPNTDYYIVVTKDGYDTYTSPTIHVATELVKFSARMNPPVTGVIRIAGGTRIDTAIELAKSEFTGKVNSIIFATADNYPDALAGSVLAYQQKAPILLVGDSKEDQDKVLTYMKDYLVSNGKVFLLGGTGVVTDNFASKVKTAGYSDVTRLGGADRYETAAKIADYLNVDMGTPVIIASGENYPDALAVSSAAAVNQYPILLTANNDISSLVKNELAKLKPCKVYIIGGQGAISDAVQNQTAQITALDSSSIIRLGGADRYSTSVIVANNFKLPGKSACIATGNNFPDALTGSIYAANYNAPIILVGSTLTDEEKAYLKALKLSGAAIFGGQGAVNDEIQNEVTGLLSK